MDLSCLVQLGDARIQLGLLEFRSELFEFSSDLIGFNMFAAVFHSILSKLQVPHLQLEGGLLKNTQQQKGKWINC